MPITITPSEPTTLIRIDGEFTIYTAADSRQQLSDALNAHPAFSVELDAIEEIDTSGVQLLLMLNRDAAKLGKPLTLKGASPAVQEVINLLQLSELQVEPSAQPESEEASA